MFILKNSRNGYFTKFSTITSKFNITEQETWNVVGMLLAGGELESVHDQSSGEMKICEIDKKYHIMNMSRKRKLEERSNSGGQKLGGSSRQGHDRHARHDTWDSSKKHTKKERRDRIQSDKRRHYTGSGGTTLTVTAD